MGPNPLLMGLHALENWLERTEGQRALLPLRWAGRTLLLTTILLSNIVALVRWPLAAMARTLGAGNTAPECEGPPADPVHRLDLPAEPIEVDAEALGRFIDSGRRVLVDF